MNEEIIIKTPEYLDVESAIKNGGFYGKNGTWNSIKTFAGDNRLYRERVETIVVKNMKEVFVKKLINGDYLLPGGSTSKDVPNIIQAENECHEEIHSDIKNIESTGIIYKSLKNKTNTRKSYNGEIYWDGSITEVYVAEYNGHFDGKIDKVDEDPFIMSGRWYSIKECFKFFKKEHKEALSWFLKNREQNININESYLTNYFGNKRFLKKISQHPEITKNSVEEIVDSLSRRYRELMAKSKIKREMRTPDAKYTYYPVMEIDFEKNINIVISIVFDLDEFSEAYAVKHDSEESYIVAVTPKFFKSPKEKQVYIILHEIGHIRLKHLEKRNVIYDLFGNNITERHRDRAMVKGKVIYPEVNADLYAILNGASMYAILSSHHKRDYDINGDYRFTNNELANRYTSVFKRYKKLRGFNESTYPLYDIAIMTIYESVFKNEKISFLSDYMKQKLYNEIKESYINPILKDNNDLLFMEEAYDKECKLFKELYNDITIESSESEDYNEIGLKREKINTMKIVIENTKNYIFNEKFSNMNTYSDRIEFLSSMSEYYKNDIYTVLENIDNKSDVVEVFLANK